MVRYSDSQTETQDSSLTQIYDQGSAYFNDQQDLKAFAGFQAFSTNSGSEVDDSASVPRTQLACAEFVGQSIESAGSELAFSNCAKGALSLGVTQSSEKVAIVPAEPDSTKKIADTFGQRTSIYRGVTRYLPTTS
jgi:AP2-like factor (ANT lineage)